ncbi:MAG: hypothetical protein U5R49_00710 [Deltaproteobacteria bacterium]|nr:hypothetical protein [Deltaproteobacteria bacterium]
MVDSDRRIVNDIVPVTPAIRLVEKGSIRQEGFFPKGLYSRQRIVYDPAVHSVAPSCEVSRKPTMSDKFKPRNSFDPKEDNHT